MARRVELPDDETIRRWKQDEKLTYAEMVDRWYTLTGGRELAQPGAFAMRCSRRGWTKAAKQTNLIPWVVETRHQHSHWIQMLRYEAMRRRGEEITDSRKRSKLDYFLAERAGKTVIKYEPNSVEGFWDVPLEWFDVDIVRDPELVALEGSRRPPSKARQEALIERTRARLRDVI